LAEASRSWARHVTELRARIDGLRQDLGLASFTWTDPSLAPGTTARAVHLQELRAALQQAYLVAGHSPPVFTDPSLVAGGSTIRSAHIRELRGAVTALEDTSLP
jgi:hypothetical protein